MQMGHKVILMHTPGLEFYCLDICCFDIQRQITQRRQKSFIVRKLQSRPAVGDFNRNGFIRAQGAFIVSQQGTWDFDRVAFARFKLAIDPKGPVTSMNL
jgi:hypothetical protein